MLRSLAVFLVLLVPSLLSAQVPVLHQEGTLHGFLVLRSEEGAILATGSLAQVAHGARVTAHLTFHFKDGSLQEETAVYTQNRNFHLVSDHLVQKGPAFPHPIDSSIDVAKGQVTVRYTDDGKEQVKSEHMQLPNDLANGLVTTLLKNISPKSEGTKLSMIVPGPKPRLVKLAISPQEEDPFTIGGAAHKARHFLVKIELGGVAGVVAPVIGKQPPDTGVWILEGEAPAFLKSEGPQFQDGPIWRIELASPVWPQDKDKEEKK
jgi:hypothetical protein